MEAIEEAVFWHTVGIVAESGRYVGTGIAARWKNQTMIVTANHVVKNTRDTDLHFFFRPPGTLDRANWHQTPRANLLVQASSPIDILGRRQWPSVDLAVLAVRPDLEEQRNIKFYDLYEDLKVPHPMPTTVVALGFPADSKEILGPKAAAIAATPLWANPETPTGKLPSGFNGRTHFLLKFYPAEAGREPHGFSGSGVWYHNPTPKNEIWYPDICPLGLITAYHRTPQLIEVCRIPQLLSNLRRYVR